MIFNAGLDGETDDLTLMDRTQYELRWSQYGTEQMAFEIPEGRLEV